MKNNFIILIFCFAFLSCNPKNDKIAERVNEPDIYGIKSEDSLMNVAILSAKQSINRFNTALKSQHNDLTDFSLKVRFDGPDNNNEYIWITDIGLKNDEYTGIVSNSPMFAKQVKQGDIIKVNKADITDWKYADNGILQGGYTIRVLRDRMSEAEREQFDSEVDFIINEKNQ